MRDVGTFPATDDGAIFATVWLPVVVWDAFHWPCANLSITCRWLPLALCWPFVASITYAEVGSILNTVFEIRILITKILLYFKYLHYSILYFVILNTFFN